MRKTKNKNRIIKKFIRIAVLGFFISILGIAGVFAYFIKDLPDPTQIGQRQIIQSTKIYDRTGQVLLYDIHGEEKRTVIPLEKIPQ